MQDHRKPLGGRAPVAMERHGSPGASRHGNSYVPVWREAGRRRKETHASIEEAAEAMRARDIGERDPAGPVTFDQYAAEWIETYRGRTSHGLASSTRSDYRRSLRLYAVPHFAGIEMTTIAPRDIRAFVDDLESLGQAPSSVRKNFAPVRALLATAVEDGVIASNPASVIRVVAARRDWEDTEPRALTRAELAAFFAEVPAEWAPLFQLLAQTGLRISEAIGLTWADISLAEPPVLRVRRQIYRGRVGPPKTRYGRRTIPLSPYMARTLAGLRATSSFAADDDPVFCTSAGTTLDASNLRRRVLRPTAERAGLGRVGFHTFRHTCASLLFEAGRNIKQIQEWLGHHDPGFTLSTYVHLIDLGLGDADFLDAAIGAGSRAA